MRRWTGPVNQWNVDLCVISYEDDASLSTLLANQLDPIMESLAHNILGDTIITNNQTYVWVTDAEGIHGLNLRLRNSDTVSANFLVSNGINIVSLFTYVTFGPRGHRQPPTR